MAELHSLAATKAPEPVTSISDPDQYKIASVRRLEDAPAVVQKFSNVSNADMVRSLCHSHVPGWNKFPEERIVIDIVPEEMGLSNQNFKVYLDLSEHELMQRVLSRCVAFKVFGTAAEKLYDAELVAQIGMMLSKYGIGPAIYAKDTLWRIEDWHYSVPLPNKMMKNPSIWVQMASHMGRLHKLGARPDFPNEIGRLPPLSMTRLTQWPQTCQESLNAFTAGVSAEDLQKMLSEVEWLKGFLVEGDPRIKGSGLDVVFSHWDVQENNVLQTLHGLRFIDFEYAGMDYQAWDIASYFVQCAIDYLVSTYPFYKVTLTDFPSEEEMQAYCAIYLSEYLETKILPNDLPARVLSQRVERFTLASHLLWSFWSLIRAGQAPTFGEFDYLHYAKSRWSMYKWSKRQLLSKKRELDSLNAPY